MQDELRRWLATEEGRADGRFHEGGTESVGHEDGRSILALSARKTARPTEKAVAAMSSTSAGATA